jgi:AbrB family looped-hinge helix DNA binding protein
MLRLTSGGEALYSLPMESTVTSKGQITLPAEIREQLDLRPGTVVRFELREGGVFLCKDTSGEHPVDRVFGQLRLEKPVDVLLDEMRGPRPGHSDR